MAVNISRSQNAELNEGATDGKYRKVRPNTTVDPGMGDEIMRANRQGLHPFWNYDFIDSEETSKVSPGSNKAGAVSPRQGQTPVAAMENLTSQTN
jgi:hypothetical protein